MATVELRPGDVLNIVWSSVQNTPLGRKEVESSFSYEYDDLLVQLKARGRRGVGRRNSGTEGARFSRLVALTVNAIKKGTWSTGARIDRDVVYGKMIKRFGELDSSEYVNITPNAKKSITYLIQKKTALRTAQKRELNTMLETIHAS